MSLDTLSLNFFSNAFYPELLNAALFRVTLVAVATLSIATFLNAVLSGLKPRSDIFKKIKVIIKSWWWIVGSLLVSLHLGSFGLLALFTLINLLVIKEYLFRSELQDKKALLSSLLVLSVLIQSLALALNLGELFLVLPIVFMFATIPPLVFVRPDIEKLPKLFSSYIGITLVTHALFYVPALMIMGPDIFGSQDATIYAIFLILFLTVINDVSQFIFGKLFGRNKIVPLISPNKTEAGFIGGVATTTSLGALGFVYLVGLPLDIALLMGFLISVLGIFGDLFFSTVKRYFKVKDFSDALPGHGGYIDRLDSLIFIIPVVFNVLKFLVR